METNTARNFVLQLGSLISLYVSLSALIAVVFSVINITYPDAANGSYQFTDAQNGIRFGIAMLFVFFPTYLALTRAVNNIRRKETGTYLTLTKWLVYLSLLIGGGILLGDLVAVILTYLNGEITTRFILKALTLCFVIGTAFYYYILDARSYWNGHEQHSLYFAAGASVIVIAALVLGFFHSDTPAKTRDMRLDEQQVNDLSNIQYRVEDSYRVNGALPQDIKSLFVGIEPVSAPAGRDAYEYKVLGDMKYQLCATFAYPSTPDGSRTTALKEPAAPATSPVENPYNNWDHGAGKTCFTREVVKDKTAN